MGIETPLWFAVASGRAATVHILLASGAKVSRKDGYFLLFQAYRSGDAAVLSDLMDYGAVVNAFDWGGILLQAVTDNNLPAVRVLLSHRANVMNTNVTWHSAIEMVKVNMAAGSATRKPTAARREIVRLLKAAGAKQ